MPFEKLKEWLQMEKERGVNDPYYAVLSTCDGFGTPHSRVLAIREITDNLLFFTQQRTRKVSELLSNSKSCFNFFLSMQSRQIVLEGESTPISFAENELYWNTLPRERQLRFSSYAPTSGQNIQDLGQLEIRKKELIEQFAGQHIPMSEHYRGFRFIPHTWFFYSMGSVSFSEVIKYSKQGNLWISELLSP